MNGNEDESMIFGNNGEGSSVDSSDRSSEQEGNVSSSSASGEKKETNEATSSASGSGSSSGEVSSRKTRNSSEAGLDASNGPSSSSGNLSKLELAEKNYCNSPDSSTTGKKNALNGAGITSGITQSKSIEPQIGEVSASGSPCKADSVSSSSISETGIVANNDDKSQPISSTKHMPTVDDGSSSDDDDNDESYEGKDSSDTDYDSDEDEEVDDSDAEQEGDGIYENDDENNTFLDAIEESGPGSSSGCTACVALLVGTDLYVANAGDSRCVVCR